MIPTLSNLRIADLELFVTAARLSHLGQAASTHHTSQSAASAAIQRVEAAFQCDLCTHEKRHFALTKEGVHLLPQIEEWISSIKETFAKKETSPLKIATTHAIARAYISPILTHERIELTLCRPDIAYGTILQNKTDIALVPDNALWEGVLRDEIDRGTFQLYATEKKAKVENGILLPEDQIEVLKFQQRWQELYDKPIPIKARIPSWSLIADICQRSKEIGFLPDFLTHDTNLVPVLKQPSSCTYRLLALYKNTGKLFLKRLNTLLTLWKRPLYL